ncbi:membrane protein [Spirosoma terrae]
MEMWAADKLIMNEKTAKKIARMTLGGTLFLAGLSHLTFARKDFRAQVPDWVPLEKDDTVVYSGIAEMALGGSLLLANDKNQELVGKVAATFFTAIFPGNISQYVNKRSAFGLDTDTKRLVRLFFQPALVYWALKSTDNV